MQKKIAIDQVRLGMFIHALEGSWLEHSIWRTRFLLDDPARLTELRTCGLRECWIDTARGLDVEYVGETLGTPPVPGTGTPPPTTLHHSSTSMAEELQHAQLIRARAKVVVTSMFTEARLGKSIDPEVCAPLVAEVVDSVHRNSDALVSLSRLKLADEYTYMHSVTVCALMVSLGRQLGFDHDQCHEAGMAGLMHDIGKAAMPMEIINKPGKLTDAEFDVIRGHPARGHEMLLRAGVSNETVLDVCLHHHERMDGKGYPSHLDVALLSRLARMGAICDVYDAITSNRPYKAGWGPAESIAQMASWKGHFDQELLRVFIRSLGIYPTGSLVRLTSGRLAIVIEQNPARLTEPKVKVIFSTAARAQLKPEVLDLHAGTSECIVGREPPENWPFLDIGKLWLGSLD
jgi:putative nucleotidyltransferase with HDIG domain